MSVTSCWIFFCVLQNGVPFSVAIVTVFTSFCNWWSRRNIRAKRLTNIRTLWLVCWNILKEWIPGQDHWKVTEAKWDCFITSNVRIFFCFLFLSTSSMRSDGLSTCPHAQASPWLFKELVESLLPQLDCGIWICNNCCKDVWCSWYCLASV